MKPTMRFLNGAVLAAGLMVGTGAYAQSPAAAPAATPAGAPPATADAAQAAIRQTVDRLQTTLVDVMRHAATLGYKGRYKQLDPVVRGSFDFALITRIVMGADWAKLSADEQGRLQEALTRLSVSMYASEFDDYSGQKFTFDGARAAAGGQLVRYIFQSGNDRIHFDYQMRRTAAGDWKIANVIVDGVSDLALKSGQYRSLFEKQGFKGLVSWINQQIEKNGG
ncbi:MAG: hypothetical protein EPN72_11485 [Nevskiaceae bacterium]|nr:MAG: hypothetical protein EPN63_01495 [Nevskiaceae bacterium]TBR71818.1 MAG: hypothetical protein EPN72_11485 [Nevskiaceae bacterium]